MLTIATETFLHVAAEAEQLAAAHWDEVEAALHGAQHYRLDHERYASLERLGMYVHQMPRALARGRPVHCQQYIQCAAGGLRRLYPGGLPALSASHAGGSGWIVSCPVGTRRSVRPAPAAFRESARRRARRAWCSTSPNIPPLPCALPQAWGAAY